MSHDLFRDRYGRPGKGNDKGNAEGLVGYSRRNFMVPIPRFASWDVFNGDLEEQCRQRQADVLRGQASLRDIKINLHGREDGEQLCLIADVYGYVIERDGEEVDACWGFLCDYELDCMSEARAFVDQLILRDVHRPAAAEQGASPPPS